MDKAFMKISGEIRQLGTANMFSSGVIEIFRNSILLLDLNFTIQFSNYEILSQ